MTLLLVVLLPFLGALLRPLLIRSGRNTCAVAASVTLLALVRLLSHSPEVFSGQVPKVSLAWAPSVGLSLSVFADGLGFFFAAMILAIGFLVIVYARYYLSREDPMGRFFAYL